MFHHALWAVHFRLGLAFYKISVTDWTKFIAKLGVCPVYCWNVFSGTDNQMWIKMCFFALKFSRSEIHAADRKPRQDHMIYI